MTPSELWDAFEDAYMACPQADELEDWQEELGQPGTYGKLKKKYETVIGYWMDPETRGGSTLHESGYLEALDADIKEMVEQYQQELVVFKKQLAKRIFG